MADFYTFDTTARSERYFVNTIFAHLILADNFKGLKRLFENIYKDELTENVSKSSDFEIVTELDALRDGALQNPEIKDFYVKHRRIAVPDMFLRWASKCLVVEAKFFSDPSDESLRKQVERQKTVIDLVKNSTKYASYEFRFVAISIKRESAKSQGVTFLSWKQVLDFIGDLPDGSDISYCKTILLNGLERATAEICRGDRIAYETIKFDKLIDDLPRLIREKKIYIGYVGGIRALEKSGLDPLKNRSHYKVSYIKWGSNWIPIDKFLHRYFELSRLVDKYDEVNC